MVDEGSNHLDRPSAMALAKCLSQFTGAMVAISQDIEFCEAMDPTHIVRVDPNGTVTVSLCINGVDRRYTQLRRPPLPHGGTTTRPRHRSFMRGWATS
ncbi:hypothetical protein KC19_1G004800 [Ceratodon purpureus]|uniref:Uncharacterized protein n=1 Tax=Ceratodon purpureus TaxID=3225 RepID=A0A8T0J384_CERPU|nr:hypothetical protein KC19_1G004800 [Ceratodon purpureus]